MEYIVDAAEMQRADENTIQYFGVPQLVLMERAALTAKDFLLQKWPKLFQENPHILIAVGNGNNGGDGAALARLFFLMGLEVTVLVNGNAEKYSSALRTQMEILEKYRANQECGDYRIAAGGDSMSMQKSGEQAAYRQSLRIVSDDMWEPLKERDAKYDLVIDALFGIGLSREVAGIYREKIKWLNALPAKKAALDIPSGISAQDGSVLGCAFRADMTITFGFLKRGMLLYPGRMICGEVKVADIGITEESFLGKYPAGVTIRRMDDKKSGNPEHEKGLQRQSQSRSISQNISQSKSKCGIEFLVNRRPDGHKGSFGKVLLLAGSIGAPGAALLAGEAVLRSGAGMLRIVSPLENREAVITRLPEAMYQALSKETDWEKMLAWCDSVVIGPGIGQGELAKESMESILILVTKDGLQRPLVIDADGLNLIAASEKLSGLVKGYAMAGGIVIMTPHMAEFARLCHCSMQELQEERTEKVRRYAQEMGVILVCKDAVTVVGFIGETGEFRYYINQTGNSGMATAGSGDVLSGIATALTALVSVNRKEKQEDAMKKEAYFEAAYRAVYLHGLSGDRAAAKYGEVSMKAGDIIEELPRVLTV